MTPLTWPLAFALTLALETPIYVWLLSPVLSRPAAIGSSVFINSVTHPIVWFVFPRLLPWPRAVVGAELFAWWTEAALLYILTRRSWARRPLPALEALLVSLVANALSCGVGFLLF